MNTAQNIALPGKWVQALKLEPRLGHDVFVEATPGMPYAGALRDALSLGVCAVHCIKGIPSTVFLDNRNQDRETLDRVHGALWNQGVADFLLAIREDSLAIYSLWASPPEKTLESEKLDLRFLDSLAISDHKDIADLLPRVESGTIFADYAPKLNPKDRVDVRLISDLSAYRKILVSVDHIPQGDAHKALLQVMFLRYLWDRGIISEKHTRRYGGDNYTTLHGLLRGSKNGWKVFLTFLSKAFNGNMLLPDDSVWELGGKTLAMFLEGIYNPEEDRNRLVPLYQFNHIPVELISEVYDRFLEGAGEKKSNGAYYTPRRLANLVVDQAWPAVQASLGLGITPQILDPTCGSGIFLVTLLQRMACHLGCKGSQPNWAKLKEMATNLHGRDINKTAIHIASFSIALALLNERKPKEIESELGNNTAILPSLLGNSLRQQDFFNLPETEAFDLIIGNPPWGQQKDEVTSGETWCALQKYTVPNREKAWPFLWKAPRHLKTKGTLALLLSMTGCIYINGADKALSVLLKTLRLDCLIDLSDLRNTLFPVAKVPACIFSATREDNPTAYRYMHLCPKADYHASKAGRILLTPDDRHSVWVQNLQSSPGHLCQRLMWITPVEERLLGYLETLPRLDKLMRPTLSARKASAGARPEWGIGLGFQIYREDKEKGRKEKIKKFPELLAMPYLPTDHLVPWVQPHVSTTVKHDNVVWKRFAESFDAPHIVMIPSTTEDAGYRLRATYSEQSFSFNMSLMGIVVPDTHSGRETAKLLTAILNSTFVAWYIYYLTNLGADRERLAKRYTFLNLPFPEPLDVPNMDQALKARTEIVRIMDGLLSKTSGSHQVLATQLDINSIRLRIDDLVFAYYGVREHEAAIIKEFFSHIRPAMHPAASHFPALWEMADVTETEDYCTTLGSTLSRRTQDARMVHAAVIAKSGELALVRISQSIGMPEERAGINTQEPVDGGIDKLLPGLRAKMLFELRHNIYLERAVFFFFNQDAYMIKPMQRRFWLTRSAIQDADRFLDLLLTPIESSDQDLLH
ncbi:MAG: class I SAM-dependent DNA methyltransferase [Desulfovibrio sp.]